MTEITDNKISLAPASERFVLHWGEMGTRWGVNRSIGQIHALLYLSERPLTAETIAATLDIARSNVSNSMRDLESWQLVRRVHVLGDRRDHFEAETELWEMLMRIAEGRKTREIDPTLDVMRACAREAKEDDLISPTALKRIAAMLKFLETLDTWYRQMSRLPKVKVRALIKMGSAIARFVGTPKSKGGVSGATKEAGA